MKIIIICKACGLIYLETGAVVRSNTRDLRPKLHIQGLQITRLKIVPYQV